MYKKYTEILASIFGGRVQKITINAGFTCPNRDGVKGRGGCIYCNNASFSPSYNDSHKSITSQIDDGIEFFSKYKAQRYIAYFQSYTNTYLSDRSRGVDEAYSLSDKEFESLRAMYEEALCHPKVIGIVVGTRPDCVDERLLDYFADLSNRYYVMIEYGVESTNDRTLDIINRGHTYADSVWAIEESARRGIETGCHLILGLPSEGRNEAIFHAKELSRLPIDVLKIHQLQIIKDTILHKRYQLCPSDYPLFSLGEYIELLVDFIEVLNPKIALDRFISQSPPEWLIAPRWDIKNFEFVHKLEKRMRERGAYQGRYYVGG